MAKFSHMVDLAVEIESDNDQDNLTENEILGAVAKFLNSMRFEFDMDRFCVVDTIEESQDDEEDEVNFGTFKGDPISILGSRVEVNGSCTFEIIFMDGPRKGERTRIDQDENYNDLTIDKE